MMSTKMISGWLSAILARASKPSTAVMTLHPTFFSSVSAVRRMVLLSSMTMTFRLSKFSSINTALVIYGSQLPGGQDHQTDQFHLRLLLAQFTQAIHNASIE